MHTIILIRFRYAIDEEAGAKYELLYNMVMMFVNIDGAKIETVVDFVYSRKQILTNNVFRLFGIDYIRSQSPCLLHAGSGALTQEENSSHLKVGKGRIEIESVPSRVAFDMRPKQYRNRVYSYSIKHKFPLIV